MAKSTKYNRKDCKARAAAIEAARPAPTLENLKARLAALPKFGESKREIAKLQAKIAEMEK
jgi:hypothetical protein